MAAVTTDQDAKIYVYDFESEEWGEFELYNPTYTEGVNSAGPVYADALEFDYTGEFLVYDCFNRITSEDGADIEYWDVNFIHVWDNDANDFADGTIEKLLLIGSVFLVLITEILNSAVERAIDRISFERHELSKEAKDMGSAAVMLSVTLAVIVWVAIILF